MLEIAGAIEYAAMHQVSLPTHPQEVASAHLASFALKYAEMHSHDPSPMML